MTETDILGGYVRGSIAITRTITESTMKSGPIQYKHEVTKTITDGTSSQQFSVVLAGVVTVTTGGVTVSFANADPFGAAGDSTSSGTVEGLKLKSLLIENTDATNYVTIKKGTNGIVGVLSGTTDSLRVSASSFFLWYDNTGSTAMNDGVDDEILLTADTASCSVKLTAGFG